MIAVVGSSCVLPGALSPAQLWDAVIHKRDLLGNSSRAADKRGGFVTGFDQVFSPERYRPENWARLDDVYRWTAHCAFEAFASGGIDLKKAAARTGAVFGNLSYPTAGLSRFAQTVWAGGADPGDSRNRFTSGYPADFLTELLGLGGGAFALDAACASSLYAIKYACDRLEDGAADFMLAGGVNAAEVGFIQKGFGALQALSPSGQSRPFHRQADGLIPAEGAAFVLLRRLEDAVRDRNPILGVIRGVGLSNDGRGTGFLSPSSPGQIEAMRAAYRSAGLDPASIQLIECHATGTQVGDAVELESMGRVFGEAAGPIVIGSLKSNLGHSITAAGAAGLIKVLEAMRARVLPPSREASGELSPALDGSRFELLEQPRPWTGQGPRRAAVSGFGFGGVNAHLVVEEWQSKAPVSHAARGRGATVRKPSSGRVAVVGLQTYVAGGADRSAWLNAMIAGQSLAGKLGEIRFAPGALRFPPRDLERTLPQQLWILKAAQEALGQVTQLDTARTGVFVGMQCDAEAVRKGLLPEGELEAADVVGCMPNIVANRINSQFDLKGPGIAVSLEDRSGTQALRLALRALAHREIDAAVVGAVEIACEPAHMAAVRATLGSDRHVPGDAAVAMVLKRAEDTEKDGDNVLAWIDGGVVSGAESSDTDATEALDGLTERSVGYAHSASGLLNVGVAILGCASGLRPVVGVSRLEPWFAPVAGRVLQVGGFKISSAERSQSFELQAVPRVYLLSSAEVPMLGAGRLAIVALNDPEMEAKKARALERLQAVREPKALEEWEEGVYYASRPLGGELALVFTGAGAAYPGMGRELALAFPSEFGELATRMAAMGPETSWIYDRPGATRKNTSPSDKLWATSFLSQLHARIAREILGLKPQAALGVSSGETNALFAFGAWSDLEAMHDEIQRSGIYGRELSGEFRAARRAWGLKPHEQVDWTCWVVRAPAEEVRKALNGEKRAYLMIIDSPSEVLIGGQREDCERVIGRVGREKASLSSFSLAVHCPVVEHFSIPWEKIHTRRTESVEGVRFYTHADGKAYRATREAASRALLGQALRTVDFPSLARKAWDEGVRIFVEAGPGDFCSGWIRESLGEREHVAVALDRPSRGGLEQLAHTAAILGCAGVAVDLEALERVLGRVRPKTPLAPKATVAPQTNAPPPSDAFPSVSATSIHEPASLQAELLPSAPALPSVLETFVRRQQPAPVQIPATEQSGALQQSDLFSPILAVQQEMARAHGRYLESQREVHRQFLRLSGEVFAQEAADSRPKPLFTRQDLEVLASGRISDIFGPLFSVQDGFSRQVRMPQPPLLLADRIMAIDAVPGSMETGRLWSETDVRAESWYLNAGTIPPGVMIEAGQADLLLISWLGADFLNRGERVYRLLGCDLTYYGPLPRAGETLTYEIHVDGHADHDGTRIFFFHSECRVNGELRQTVRNGQAGFFTDAELAGSAGVLWSPQSERPEPARVDAPSVRCQKSSFAPQEVFAFSEGHIRECFGPGFERAETHICTPRIQSGRMLLLGQVSSVDPQGGPWGRGYLRATLPITQDSWFFEGHFKDDPCMPGTLMFDGCLQAMSFYLAYQGYTLERDGWRFEPETDSLFELRCRGQVTPQSRELVYEVFVRELHEGPEPKVVADVLCTVDGLKAFHAKRLKLRLRRDYPLAALPELEQLGERRPFAVADGFGFGENALVANALGSPEQAFGDLYRNFDRDRGYGFPRLPAPPFLFLTRLARLELPEEGPAPGMCAEFEYDVGPEAWYFGEKGISSLPLCVMIEAALQPCVWISAYMGVPKSVDHAVQCRNLGGNARWYEAVWPESGTLTIRSRVTGTSMFGDTEIQNCDIECLVDGRKVFEGQSVSGNFTRQALESQAGLAISPEEARHAQEAGNTLIELAGYGRGDLRLPDGALLMADRITGIWPGQKGVRIRAEKEIRPDAWYFKAHFPNDPVQPGSLGLEAIVQVLKFHMLYREMDAGIEAPVFEPIALGREFSWKYRGQILHTNRLMKVELEVKESLRDADGGATVIADAWIWIDGKKIYEAKDFGMRIAPGGGRGQGQGLLSV